MGVFHVFQIVQIEPNHAKRHDFVFFLYGTLLYFCVFDENASQHFIYRVEHIVPHLHEYIFSENNILSPKL